MVVGSVSGKYRSVLRGGESKGKYGAKVGLKEKWENDVFSILFPKMPSNFRIFPHNDITSVEKMEICLISKKKSVRSARKYSVMKNLNFKGSGNK